jgi:hypothetical protein
MVQPNACHAKNGIYASIYNAMAGRVEQDDFSGFWENFPIHALEVKDPRSFYAACIQVAYDFG